MMKQRVRLALFVGLAAVLGMAGCEKQGDVKDDQAQAEEPTDKERAQNESDNKQEESEQDKPGAKDKSPNSSGVPGTANQLTWDQDIPEVDFEITNPEGGATVEGGELEVEFSLDGYRIGPEIGQHIHFVLDNQPYRAHYNDGEPIVYEDLESGTHTLRAFPSRHYHLSLKKGKPMDTVVFHVDEKSEDFSFDPSKPYLTYSRPKGTYSAKAAENLMLDFYVSNVELGDDARVVYSVDGEKQGELTEWKPVLMSLEPGEHKVNLKLVDGDGNLIENGGYNDTTRTITVEEK
jgi:hypothetical protein